MLNRQSGRGYRCRVLRRYVRDLHADFKDFVSINCQNLPTELNCKSTDTSLSLAFHFSYFILRATVGCYLSRLLNLNVDGFSPKNFAGCLQSLKEFHIRLIILSVFFVRRFLIMRRGRGKGKKQITRNDNAESGQEEKLPGQKRKSPQELLSNKAEEDEETEKVEDECKNGMISTTKEDAKDQSSIHNGRKRKRSSPIKENLSPSDDKIGSGTKSCGLTDGSVKSVGFRQLGSRRKSKPRRAAEAGVECK
ncbi:hypothetical protein Nepgr_031202 [Nepenthes gracilis]|uniref:Uncharacterized protein n=1 Tax=Nepenthes gracilis TaxID=150966 RepID=A0AAD3THV5_NEPGR|nr:hypothetical protein Nepgr_031202 [Nepenthes gracilis]